jgi:hypothetical protein
MLAYWQNGKLAFCSKGLFIGLWDYVQMVTACTTSVISSFSAVLDKPIHIQMTIHKTNDQGIYSECNIVSQNSCSFHENLLFPYLIFSHLN